LNGVFLGICIIAGDPARLRIIAGFVVQSAGQVVIGVTAVDDLPPNRRAVAPHLMRGG
jgi:ABC-type thiamine transport system ATPase subunit